jgi:chloramphenicol O-acetyltransferase type A
MGRLVDLKKWRRREHFRMFRHYQQPFFSVTVEVDVTALWKRCRAPDSPPFFLTSLFFMLRAINAVEAFRLRLRTRGVWLHDRVAVGTTLLRPDHTFGFARAEPDRTLEQFIAEGEAAIARAKRRKTLAPQRAHEDDVVYHSTLPWFRFTSFTNALRRRDSIPRIVFGKCSKDGRAIWMPVAVEVHHALVDGLDVARFLDRFELELSSLREHL